MAEEKTYVFGDTTGNNGLLSLLGPLMQQRGIDPSVLLAMRNNEGGFGEVGQKMFKIAKRFLCDDCRSKYLLIANRL